MEKPPEEVREIQVIPLKPGQTQWVKQDDGWLWETTYFRMTASVVNAESTRELLIDIRNQHDRNLHAIALIPKNVMTDLYTELYAEEITKLKAEVNELRQRLDRQPVEVDDDPAQTA